VNIQLHVANVQRIQRNSYETRGALEIDHAGARICVPRILQWRGFKWWGTADQGLWDRRSPDAEAKCEISVQVFTFSCRKFGD